MDQTEVPGIEIELSTILRQHLPAGVFDWLQEKARLIKDEKTTVQLNITFAAIPRKTGKPFINNTSSNQREDDRTATVSIGNWPLDRIARLWLLMQLNANDQKVYCSQIEGLFKAAEVNELVALYSALPTLKYPEAWKLRCAEGIRSNIGPVLEAIMYENQYPHKYLEEPAWNQMVLKAFFTDKDVNRIIGLDQRANTELAAVLVNYAHERWAAHRTVNPLLWRLVSKYIDEDNFPNLLKLYNNGDSREKKAAVLACYRSDYEPAKQLAESDPGLLSEINDNTLRWDTI